MATMLWRSSETPRTTLLGSIHFLDSQPLPEWATAPAKAAEAVIYEVAIPESVRFPELPARMTVSALAPRLAPAIKNLSKRLSLDYAALDRISPFSLLTVLEMNLLPQDHSVLSGVERVLPLNVKPSHLETLEDQFAAIGGAPLAEQLGALKHFLQDTKHYPARMRAAAAAAWRKGDLAALSEALELPRLWSGFPEITRSLFTDRNKRWVEPLLRAIRESEQAKRELLIVVGCGHLFGPDNVPSILAEHGYSFHQE